MFVIVHPTGYTIRLSSTREHLIDGVKSYPLRSYIITYDIMEFLFFMIVPLQLIQFVRNLNPSPPSLIRILLQNLLPNSLPILLLKHRYAKALNPLLHQFYRKFGGTMGPLPSRKKRGNLNPKSCHR